MGYQKTAQDLILNASQWDETQVSITAEVIGDIMQRKDWAWFHLQDSTGTISVFAPLKMASLIHNLGGYQQQGDIVSVEGRFFRADPDLGGELYIRANKIKIVSRGNTMDYPLNPIKLNLTYYFGILALALGFLRLTIKRKSQGME